MILPLYRSLCLYRGKDEDDHNLKAEFIADCLSRALKKVKKNVNVSNEDGMVFCFEFMDTAILDDQHLRGGY